MIKVVRIVVIVVTFIEAGGMKSPSLTFKKGRKRGEAGKNENNANQTHILKSSIKKNEGRE